MGPRCKRKIDMKWFAVARPWLAVASVAAVLAGCSLAPEYQRPGQPVPDNYPQLTPATDDLTAPSAADLGWSELFKDPQLQALVAVALENNRDLRIAIDRVEEARAMFGIARSERFPSVGIGEIGRASCRERGRGGGGGGRV